MRIVRNDRSYFDRCKKCKRHRAVDKKTQLCDACTQHAPLSDARIAELADAVHDWPIGGTEVQSMAQELERIRMLGHPTMRVQLWKGDAIVLDISSCTLRIAQALRGVDTDRYEGVQLVVLMTGVFSPNCHCDQED